MELRDKVALVTGASIGIGREIALRLAREGADVAVNYRSHEKEAEEVKESILGYDRKAITVKASVGDLHEVEEMVRSSLNSLGRSIS